MADTLQTELDESRGFLRVPAAASPVFHLPPWQIAKKTLTVSKGTHEFVAHEIRSPWYHSRAL